jgi:hypothetical protein
MRRNAYPPEEEGEIDDPGRRDDLRDNLDGLHVGARSARTTPL